MEVSVEHGIVQSSASTFKNDFMMIGMSVDITTQIVPELQCQKTTGILLKLPNDQAGYIIRLLKNYFQFRVQQFEAILYTDIQNILVCMLSWVVASS